MILHLEKETYNSPYKDYFDALPITIKLKDRADLCRAMLWRVEPVDYADYTICRDLDALPTLRERQAVEIWIRNDTLAHSMNDSISHCIPLMGGMIGFKKNAFPIDITGNFRAKGSDQTWLNNYVYPKVSHSITEHRILGMAINPDNPYSNNYIQDIKIEGLPPQINESNDLINHIGPVFKSMNYEDYKDSNDLVNHIGQAGFHLDKTTNTITNKTYAGAVNYWVNNNPIEDKLVIESQYKDIFYWQK